MKISVIIPTYKPQVYLKQCLDSLAAQTLPKADFEVILVLNGCKEPYETQIHNYLAKYTDLQVNFIQTNQGGVSNARNLGLDIARGKYIAFIDDDDYISQSYLEELYVKAAPNTISLCYPYAFNDGKPSIQIPYPISKVYDKQSKYGKQFYTKSRKFFTGPCMKLIPMSFIQNRRFDKRFRNGEDSLFMFLISDRFRYVDYTSTNAIYYRRYRIGSAITTHRSAGSILKNGFNLVLAYCNHYFKHPLQYNMRFFLSYILGTFRVIMKPLISTLQQKNR